MKPLGSDFIPGVRQGRPQRAKKRPERLVESCSVDDDQMQVDEANTGTPATTTKNRKRPFGFNESVMGNPSLGEHSQEEMGTKTEENKRTACRIDSLSAGHIEPLSEGEQESLCEIACALSQFREVLKLQEMPFTCDGLALILSTGLKEGSLLQDLFKVVVAGSFH